MLERLASGVVRRRGAVILLWLLIAGAMNLAVPQLEQVIGRSTSPMVPDDAVSVRALHEMDKRFGGAGANSMVIVVLADENGFSAVDQQYYERLVDRLRNQRAEVAFVQDVVSQPGLKEALASRDGKARYIPLGLWGHNGSPETTAQIQTLRAVAQEQRPPGLQVHITGPMATVADMQAEMEHSMLGITIVTVALITGILLLIYRSVITAMVALTTVGISLATARAVVAFFGLDVFSVSTFTASFLTVVVFGACTDYSVFLISRFHEYLRSGYDAEDAVAAALKRVATVVLASAATVIVACSGMALAEVSFFYATGPAIAIGIAVTLLAALTLCPAVLAVVAKRGYARPRRKSETHRWNVIGKHVTLRPARVLVAGLVILGALAAFYPGIRPSYDTHSVQPASTDSNLGNALMAKHFPPNEVYPEYVLIDSDRDMRNPRDLAALEMASSDVSKIDEIAMVRGVTRPLGSTITEASIGQQAGQVGDALNDGVQQLNDSIGTLAQGTARLAEGSGRLSDGVTRAIDGADQLLNGLTSTRTGLGAGVDGADQAQDAAQQLADGAKALATGLDLARDQTKMAVDGLGVAADALRNDPVCGLDPVCDQARQGIDEILAGQRDQLLPGLTEAASAAHVIADGNGDLAAGVGDLRNGLAAAKAGTERLAVGQRVLKENLGQLSAGANEVSQAARAISEGVAASPDGQVRLSDGTTVAPQSVAELQAGLTRAADFLRTIGSQAGDPSIGGFYLPAEALQDPRMALASGMFLSQDGRTARLFVMHKTEPQGEAAMRSSAEIVPTTQQALRGTSLDGSRVTLTGMGANNNDLDELITNDFAAFALFAVLAVLLILMVLLRSIIAPIYLLASVILSYAAAMGIAVLVWQHALGIDLSWSVAPVAFVILVAVGADYNLFLISRIREELIREPRGGIARAMISTGPVITSAGVIFAVSMLAMLSGSVTILAQVGFTIGIGLLIDTFLVRTLLVPAAIQLLGRWNWWPSRVVGGSAVHIGRSPDRVPSNGSVSGTAAPPGHGGEPSDVTAER